MSAPVVRSTALSQGPHLHFFGYYGICPWDAAGRRHLALEVADDHTVPDPEREAAVGWIDPDGAFTGIARTRAWNFQQGAMLHWLPDGSLLHNDWSGDRVVARVHDRNGGSRLLERGVAALSPEGTRAIGLDYRRNYRCRTVVGYAHHHDGGAIPDRPDDDGLWCIDVVHGTASLGVSTAEICARSPAAPEGRAWLDHVVYAPGGRRILFMCRIVRAEGGWWSSLWTADADGGNATCQIPYGAWISHFAWLDDERLLISTDLLGERGFVVVRDGRGDVAPFARGVLPEDGHPCLSPDGRWIACDTYPSGPGRIARLMLVDVEGRERVDLWEEHHPPRYANDLRCDLHPRWDRDGRILTIDSVADGQRQIRQIPVPAAR